MYVHLINWKWGHLTLEPGADAKGNVYDAWLPPAYAAAYRILYPPIVDAAKRHLAQHPFHVHPHFHHMASSQAATLNLFLPILIHPQAAAVLRQVKPDFDRLATDQLDYGFRVEFKDKPYAAPGDGTVIAAADADIGIAYYNHAGELCLWLVEHKLTEKEFTACGGFKKAVGSSTHDCGKGLAEIMAQPCLCYYTHPCGYDYWHVTAKHVDFFANYKEFASCPFRTGVNQLWRNQLLAFNVEDRDDWQFQHAYFSVVVHPDNHALDATIAAYRTLIADDAEPHKQRFSTFLSAEVVGAAATLNDAELNQWVDWYAGLYRVTQG